MSGNIQHLVQHAAMLPGHRHARDEPIILRQPMAQREQLDRFGPSAEQGQDFAGRVHSPPLNAQELKPAYHAARRKLSARAAFH